MGQERAGSAGSAQSSDDGSGVRSGRSAHLVWDWNGTLLHDIHTVIEATNAAFKELGLPAITLERYRELYCVPVPRFYERLMGRMPTGSEWEVMDETFHRHYWQLVPAAGLAEGAAELLVAQGAAGVRSRCARWRRTTGCCRWCEAMGSSVTSYGSTVRSGAPGAARRPRWCAISRRSRGSPRPGP